MAEVALFFGTLGVDAIANIVYFMYLMLRPDALRLQKAALASLRSGIGPLSAKDMMSALEASAGMIPSATVQKGRGGVLDWLDSKSTFFHRTWTGNALRTLQGVLGTGFGAASVLLASIARKKEDQDEKMETAAMALVFGFFLTLHSLVLAKMGRGRRVPIKQTFEPLTGVPKGLRTRADWVRAFPNVLEIVLTDPATGQRRVTAESYRIAKDGPAGAALVLGPPVGGRGKV